jgi:hypothetical protein
MEKRLPIAIVVHLTRLKDQPVDGTELTYTDNVSLHGARVISRRPWQVGEVAQVTSLKDETTMRGKVTYCAKLDDERYGIGLSVQNGGITWSTFQRYAGASVATPGQKRR